MDFRESSYKSNDDFSKNITEVSDEIIPVSPPSTISEKKIGDHNFSDSNDGILDSISSDSFLSVNGTTDDHNRVEEDAADYLSEINNSVDGTGNCYPFEIEKGVRSSEHSGTENLKINVEKNQNAGRIEYDTGENVDIHHESTVCDESVEDCVASDEDQMREFLHFNDGEELPRGKDSQNNVSEDTDESFTLDEVLENSGTSERDEVRKNLALDVQMPCEEYSRTSTLNDADESFLLDEVLEDSGTFERDPAKEYSSNNDQSVLENDSVEVTESLTRNEANENGVVSNELYQSHENFSNDKLLSGNKDFDAPTNDEAEESRVPDEIPVDQITRDDKDVDVREYSENDDHLLRENDSPAVTLVDFDENSGKEVGQDRVQENSTNGYMSSYNIDSPAVTSDDPKTVENFIGDEVVIDKVTLERSSHRETSANDLQMQSSISCSNPYSEKNSDDVEVDVNKITHEVHPVGDNSPNNVQPQSPMICLESVTEKSSENGNVEVNTVVPEIDPVVENSANDFQSRSSAATCDGTAEISVIDKSAENRIQFDANEVEKNSSNMIQSICEESSTEGENDPAPSSEETSTFISEKSMENVQKADVALENDEEIAKQLPDEEDNSLRPEESLSAQELLRNLRKKVSSRFRKNSDDSGLPSSEDGSSGAALKMRNKTKDVRSPKKSPSSPSKSPTNSSRSRSRWQPEISSVTTTSNDLSIRLNRLGDDANTDLDLKEEIIDESYEMQTAIKEKFNIVNFSIKLEKMDFENVDQNKEITPPSPQKSRLNSATIPEIHTSARSRSRSKMLRTRLRKSRPATIRGRMNDRRRVDRRIPTAKNPTPRSGDDSQTRVNGQIPATVSAQTEEENRFNLRSKGASALEQDLARINFLRSLNLRSRKGNGDECVKSILVKPRIAKVAAKKVSFQLPDNHASAKEQKNSPTKINENPSIAADRTLSGPATRKRRMLSQRWTAAAAKIIPSKRKRGPFKKSPEEVKIRSENETVSAETAATIPLRRKRGPHKRVAEVKIRSENETVSTKTATTIPLKRRRGSFKSPEAGEIRSVDEIVDENPYEKYEASIHTFRKTIDVWYECSCCNQKYYLIENMKQHVRSHFPNCLTN